MSPLPLPEVPPPVTPNIHTPHPDTGAVREPHRGRTDPPVTVRMWLVAPTADAGESVTAIVPMITTTDTAPSDPDHARRRRGPGDEFEPDASGLAHGVRPPDSGRDANTDPEHRAHGDHEFAGAGGVLPGVRDPGPDSDPAPATRPRRSRTRPTGSRPRSRPVRVPTAPR